MKKSRFTEQQIADALEQQNLGTSVDVICRKMGIAQATFFVWKKKYSGLGPPRLRRLRQLGEQNAKLKPLWNSPDFPDTTLSPADAFRTLRG